MYRSLSKRTIAIALCTFGVAACSSGDNSSLTAPPTVAASVADQVETQTVADVSAENASESVDVINDAEISADGGGASFDVMASTAVGPHLVSASFMAPVPGASASVVGPHGNCPFDAATSFHVCATSTDGMGFSNDRKFQFRDSAGAATPNFTDATTASINFVHHRYGVVSDSSAAGMRHRGIDRTHNLIVSGLLGHEIQRTWNGTGNSLDSGTVVNAKGTYSYNWAVAGTLTNVVRKLPASSNKFPMSGTIVRNVIGTSKWVAVTNGTATTTTTTRQVNRTLTITFDGTQNASVVMGGKTYTLDLVSYKLKATN